MSENQTRPDEIWRKFLGVLGVLIMLTAGGCAAFVLIKSRAELSIVIAFQAAPFVAGGLLFLVARTQAARAGGTAFKALLLATGGLSFLAGFGLLATFVIPALLRGGIGGGRDGLGQLFVFLAMLYGLPALLAGIGLVMVGVHSERKP